MGRYKLFFTPYWYGFGYRRFEGSMALIIDWYFSLGFITLWQWHKLKKSDLTQKK